MIFILIRLIVSESITYETNGTYLIELKAGQYTVHCYGAQGGDSYSQGVLLSNYGGRGAHTQGTMTVTGKSVTKFYAFVGGKGESGKVGPNNGGFNGGGRGGEDEKGFIDKNQDDAPGGGGGATDFRINDEDMNSRIMIAAGGSSGAGKCKGAYGGMHKIICPISNNAFIESDDEGNSDGIGGNGDSYSFQPGGGGGGGYRGGTKGVGSDGDGENYKSVGCGGSSYISGDEYYENNEKMIFKMIKMETDIQEGNGKIEIIFDFVCKDKCSSCTSETVCTECYEGFLHEGECKETCPSGYFEQEHKCEQCSKECQTCEGSSTNCLTCIDGYYHYNNKCINECPSGTAPSMNLKECLQCETKCKTCSSSPSNCISCADNFVMYNNDCISDCPKGTIKTDFTCEKCKPFCDDCIDSTVKCTSCMTGYFLYNNECLSSCPDKTYKSGSICIECKEPCSSCSTEDDCLTCKSGYYLYEKRCYESCPNGTSPSGVGCLKNQQ